MNPTTCWLHDWYIMEDILGLNLPKQQIHQLHSVCLYLHMTTLSEITDHTGRKLLLMKLHQPKSRNTQPTSEHGHSMLQWPWQASPGPLAWKQWQEVLAWLYLAPNTNTLQKLLGMSNEKYETDYHWPWHVCAWTFILFHWEGTQWYAYPRFNCHADHLIYQNKASLTSEPSNIVPATPTITTTNTHLDLPIPGLHQQPKSAYQPIPILVRLMTPSVTWALPLWHEICPHTHGHPVVPYTCHNTNPYCQRCSSKPRWQRHLHLDHLGKLGTMEWGRPHTSTPQWHVLGPCRSIWDVHSTKFLSPALCIPPSDHENPKNNPCILW